MPSSAAGRVTFQNRNVHSGRGALTLSISPSCTPEITSCSERAEVWEKP
jgi:hypothetical protein